jgi:Transglycosylase-like domain
MRTLAIAVGMAAILLVPTSAAEAKNKRTSCNNTKLVNSYTINYYAVAKQHGSRAPGRNIRKWGLSERRPSQCRHIAKSLRILRGMRFAGSNLLVPGRPHQPPAGTSTLRAGGTLEAIAQCESGGDPTTDTGNGFHGKYQFTQQTWESVGGSGNPANASEAEQDKRAAILYAREGPAPWPVCGR